MVARRSGTARFFFLLFVSTLTNSIFHIIFLRETKNLGTSIASVTGKVVVIVVAVCGRKSKQLFVVQWSHSEESSRASCGQS